MKESERIERKIEWYRGEIQRLRSEAVVADSSGKFKRADNLRSKAKDLSGKLDLAESDLTGALHRET